MPTMALSGTVYRVKRKAFKTRTFTQWMKKNALADDVLCAAIEEMQQGLIDADLGGHLYKKRVALPGRGKSGSTRTLVATNKEDKWFFLYGFEKNEKGNISKKEKEALRKVAEDMLSLSAKQLKNLIENKKLQEICHDNKK